MKNTPYKWLHFSHWFLIGIVTFSIAFSACTKRSNSFLPEFIDPPTLQNLCDICFVNADTGFICGGDKYANGLMLHTYDGGLTWSLKDSVSPWILNGLSSKSNHSITCVGHTGKILNMPAHDSVPGVFQTFGWEELYAVQWTNDTLGIAVGGESYGAGILQRTTPQDSGVWHPQVFKHLLQDVQMVTATTGYVCGYGAVYKTVDGGKTWQITGAKGDFFKGLSFTSETVGYVVGKAGSILKTVDGGSSWQSLRNGNSLFNKDWRFNDVLFVTADMGFVLGDNGVFLRTSNAGKTWELSDYFNGNNMNKLYLGPNNTLWLIGDFGGIYKLHL